MAIFTAGCIESTGNANEIRNRIYDLAKHDLDSPAMKISVRKSPTCINFIAFLPKDKILKENILRKVSDCQKRAVIVFELDYKHVGVVCENSRIIDYILDKPEEFAQERSYEVIYADNAEGVELVSFNIDNINREAKAGFISLGFTILLTSSIFFSGYAYMQETQINKGNKDNLVKQYREIVKKEFKKSDKIVRKIDIVSALEDVEELTKTTNSTLEQVRYSGKEMCIKVQTADVEPFISKLPKYAKIKQSNRLEGIVEYCHEKI